MQIYFILRYFHLQCLYSSDSKSLCCLSVPCHRFLSSVFLLIGGHTDCDFTLDSFHPCCMLSPWTKTWSWVMCTSCKLHSKNLVSWDVQVCHWCTCWPPSHLAPTACLHENRPQPDSTKRNNESKQILHVHGLELRSLTWRCKLDEELIMNLF